MNIFNINCKLLAKRSDAFIVFFSLFLISFGRLKAQDRKQPDYCVMLKKVMEADFFTGHFYTCDTNLTLVMNDPLKSFNCNRFRVCKHDVIIENDLPNDLDFKKIEQMGLPFNNFFVELKRIKADKYRISFLQAETNASLIAEITTRNYNKMKVSLVQRGVY